MSQSRTKKKTIIQTQDISDIEENGIDQGESDGEAPVVKKPGLLKQVDVDCMLETKRSRPIPAAESKLKQWMFDNVEVKLGYKVNLNKLFDAYAKICQDDYIYAIDEQVFKKRIHDEYGDEIGIKEASQYRGIIKETKKRPPVPKSDKKPEFKIKNLIIEAIESFNNPAHGVRYQHILRYLSQNYPALRFAEKPKYLMGAILYQVRFGNVILVRGVRKCGYYRLPGGLGDEEKDEEEPKKTKKAKKEGEGEGEEDAQDGEEKEKDGTEEDKEKSGEEKTDGESGGDDDEKKKKKKPKNIPSTSRISKARHTDPRRVEDVFPMAMTYMSDPKSASLYKIKNYISKYFGVTNDSRIKTEIDKGVGCGIYERHGSAVRLELDDLNPMHRKTTEDMINLAILACHVPKVASGRLIKSYITSYHPDFNIESRPIKFRRALERCINGGLLRQVSGCGASGSFELMDPFVPSPRILAGEDREDDSDDDSDATSVVSDSDDDDEDQVDRKPERYVPQPTRSGRGASTKRSRSAAATSPRKPPADRLKTAAKRKAPRGGRPSGKQAPKYREDSEEEDDEDEEPPKKVAKGKRGRKPAAKSRQEESEEESDDEPPPPPKKTPAKKGSAKKTTPAKSNARSPASKRGSATKPARTPVKSYREDSEEEEDDESMYVAYHKTPASKRGTPTGRSKARSPAKESFREDSGEEEDDESIYVAAHKTPASKRGTPKGRSNARSPAKKNYNDDSNSDDEEPKSAKKRGSAKKSPAKKNNTQDDEDSTDEQVKEESDEENYYEIEEAPKKTPKTKAEVKQVSKKAAKKGRRR